jgi:hypothetical protein
MTIRDQKTNDSDFSASSVKELREPGQLPKSEPTPEGDDARPYNEHPNGRALSEQMDRQDGSVGQDSI